MTTEPEEPASGGKWTPGPWLAAAKPSSVVGLPVVATANGRSVASVTFFHLGDAFTAHDAESRANAHLLAAAPDLAEAAGPLVATLRTFTDDMPDGRFVSVTLGELRALRKAYHRARGGDHAG